MAKTGAGKIGADKMRAPRAHPQTVVFTFGARKKQELPFIIGAMSDLTGKAPAKPGPLAAGASDEEQKKHADEMKRFEAYQSSKKNFLEIDSGNFNNRMSAMRPKVSFQVPNRLSNEGGDLPVSIEFESMDDFKPDRVAMKVEPLRKLMEQRESLQNLLSYLDGKEDGEKLLEDLLKKIEAISK